MLIDFLQFFAQFIIAAVILRMLQIRLGDSEWGKAVAFIY